MTSHLLSYALWLVSYVFVGLLLAGSITFTIASIGILTSYTAMAAITRGAQ